MGTTLFTYTLHATGSYLLTGTVTVNTTDQAGGGEEGALTLKNGSTSLGVYIVYTSIYPMTGQVSTLISGTAGDIITLHGEYTVTKNFNGNFNILKF